jgi:AMP deaminase
MPNASLTDFGVPSELKALYDSFWRCLDLRDKYMLKSLQRLGDDPRDHDGVFHGLSPALADFSSHWAGERAI